MKRVYVRCECHEEDHVFTAQVLGQALARLRTEPIDIEKLRAAGQKGAEKRWKKQSP